MCAKTFALKKKKDVKEVGETEVEMKFMPVYVNS